MKDRQELLRRLDHYAECMDNGIHVAGSQMRKLVRDIKEIGLLHMAPPVVEAPPKFNPPPADTPVCTGDAIRCHDGHGCECAMRGQPPAEAQAQGGGEVVAWAVVGNKSGEILNVFHGTREKWLADTKYWPEHGFRTRPLVYGDTAPPSALVGDCPDCTNGEQCAKCSRGEWAGLESSAPVGVEDLSCCGGCGNADPDKVCLGCRHDFGEALAQQPAAVDEAMLRNLRDYDQGASRDE